MRFDCNDIPDYWKWNTGAEMMLDWRIGINRFRREFHHVMVYGRSVLQRSGFFLVFNYGFTVLLEYLRS